VLRLAVQLTLVFGGSGLAMTGFALIYYLGGNSGGFQFAVMTSLVGVSELAKLAGNLLALVHMDRCALHAMQTGRVVAVTCFSSVDACSGMRLLMHMIHTPRHAPLLPQKF
jgi:hypothetical protein